MSLKTLISGQKNPLIHCLPTDYIDEAIAVMIASDRNAIAVMEPGNRLCGILTDHDIIRSVHDAHNKGQNFSTLQVGDWMTAKVISCALDTKLTDSLRLMGKHKIRHLLVKDGEIPVAIVSIRDVLAQIHLNDELEVNVLRDIALMSRSMVAA